MGNGWSSYRNGEYKNFASDQAPLLRRSFDFVGLSIEGTFHAHRNSKVENKQWLEAREDPIGIREHLNISIIKKNEYLQIYKRNSKFRINKIVKFEDLKKATN